MAISTSICSALERFQSSRLAPGRPRQPSAGGGKPITPTPLEEVAP